MNMMELVEPSEAETRAKMPTGRRCAVIGGHGQRSDAPGRDRIERYRAQLVVFYHADRTCGRCRVLQYVEEILRGGVHASDTARR